MVPLPVCTPPADQAPRPTKIKDQASRRWESFQCIERLFLHRRQLDLSESFDESHWELAGNLPGPGHLYSSLETAALQRIGLEPRLLPGICLKFWRVGYTEKGLGW